MECFEGKSVSCDSFPFLSSCAHSDVSSINARVVAAVVERLLLEEVPVDVVVAVTKEGMIDRMVDVTDASVRVSAGEGGREGGHTACKGGSCARHGCVDRGPRVLRQEQLLRRR